MSTTFDSTNRYQFLAAQRAALTKALKAYRATEDKENRTIAAAKAANIINRAPALGFTQDEVASGADITKEVQSLIIKNDPSIETDGSQSIEAKEVVEAMDTTFGLERDLQRAIRANIGQIDTNLHIVDGGKEQTVASGRIDILAEDHEGSSVVIELKVGQADRDAVGQTLSYMGDVADSTKVGTTRGIIIAGDFTSRAISAASVSPNIRLLKYSFQFNFEAVGNKPPTPL
jgi:Endonuclease NucS